MEMNLKAMNQEMGVPAALDGREFEEFLKESKPLYMPGLRALSKRTGIPLDELQVEAVEEIWGNSRYYVYGITKNGIVPVEKRFGGFFLKHLERSWYGRGKIPGSGRRWGRGNCHQDYGRAELTEQIRAAGVRTPEEQFMESWEEQLVEQAMERLSPLEQDLVTLYQMVEEGKTSYALEAEGFGVCTKTLRKKARDAVEKLGRHYRRLEEW